MMILHGYSVTEAALLEAHNPFELRAVVQHQLKLHGLEQDRSTLLNGCDFAMADRGFKTLKARLISLETGCEADEFDDEVALLIDTDVEHHTTIQ